MKNYLKFKNDIQGFGDVLDTVKTVEKIAAASIHELKIKVQALLMYKKALAEVLRRLSVFDVKNNHPLLKQNNNDGKWLVIVGGEKGLVGGMHHHLMNACIDHAKNYQKFIVVGRRLNSFFEEEGMNAEKVFEGFGDIPTAENIKICTDYLFSCFADKKFSGLDILYPEFIALAEQNPVIVPFLPFNFDKLKMDNADQTPDMKIADGLPIFEPSKQIIYDRLLQQYVEVYFYEIMMEAKLSELCARTVSMEHASGKTEKFIKKIRLTYLKERRKNVTQKQLESFIVHKMS